VNRSLRVALGAWAAPLAWAVLIFLGSSASIGAGRTLFPHADKVVHALEYAVLAFLSARAFLRTRPAWAAGRVALASAALAAVYGATDELHQSFVPEREAALADLAGDAAGALAGAGLWASVCRRRAALSGAPGGSR